MPSASFSSSRNFRRSKRKSNRNNSDPNEPPNAVQIPVGGAEQSNESTTSRSASTATTSSLASELASSSSASTNASATSSNCHQSPPYDLRKKLPTTTATTATTNSGSLSESNSSSSSTWLGSASTSTSTAVAATATTSSSCCGSSQSHSFSSLANNSSSNNSNNSNQYQVCTYDSSSQPSAKKRPRRTYSNTESTTTLSAHYLQITLPDEVLLTIFSYLSEFDLCRVPLVCKRFNSIANDCELWKRLYQEVFEYDLPLMNPEPCKFSFVKVEDSEFSNPWKESFRQLHHGIHVRPNYVDKKSRSISIFNTIQSAIDYADEKNASNSSAGTIVHGSSSASGGSSSSNNFDMMDQDNNGGNFAQESPFNLIFVHTGIYRGEFLVIDSDLKMIGAAPGNVAENIIIESESESTQSTVSFAEGAKNAYIGYMTLKFSPADVSNAVPHHKHYCLEIGENCSPTVDHCIIRSTSVGELST